MANAWMPSQEAFTRYRIVFSSTSTHVMLMNQISNANAARLIHAVGVQQFTPAACNWEIMLHQFSRLRSHIEIPFGVVVTQIVDGAREACVRVLHPTFTIAFRDASRDTPRAARSRPTCSCNTLIGARWGRCEGWGGGGKRNEQLSRTCTEE